MTDNNSLADQAELYTGEEFQKALTNPDPTGLPKVLLIGDSISIGYTVDVRKLLKGKADVFRVRDNCRNSADGDIFLEEWLGDKNWDIIHFNWGLWDLCYRHPESEAYGHRDKEKGTLTATPEQYRKNMESIVAKLKRTGAKLIWCTTTPVPKNEAGRFQGDEVEYNAVAEEIMKENDIIINDLHSHALQKCPEIHTMPGDVHFTEEGCAFLAEKVAEEIEKVLLKMTGRPNDSVTR